MANLSKQTRKVTFIIQCDKYEDYECYDLLKELREYFNTCCDYYAMILHNADLTEDHIPKNNHIHCVCEFTTDYSKTRLKTHLNNLSNELKLNPFAITINYAKDFIGNVRYLLHLDSPEKYQYERDMILTNDKDLTNLYLDSTSDTLTGEGLLKIIKDNNCSLIKIMLYLGPTRYRLYRPTIYDIVKELKGIS